MKKKKKVKKKEEIKEEIKEDWFNGLKNYPTNGDNTKCIRSNKYLYLSNNY